MWGKNAAGAQSTVPAAARGCQFIANFKARERPQISTSRAALSRNREVSRNLAAAEAMTAKFYLAAIAVGVALALGWLLWLLAARAFLRAAKSTPGATLSIIQVAVVLVLMLAGYRATDWMIPRFGFDPATAPGAAMTFRRVWILALGAGMIASIQIFLDIRRMATPPPRQPRSPLPRGGRRVAQTNRRRR
jgi:hypothetical protein